MGIKKKLIVVFLFTLHSFIVMANSSQLKSRSNTLTVAKVIIDKSNKDVIITFFESQRFYKIEQNNKNFKSCIALLNESEKKKIALHITFTVPNGDIIKNVEKISHVGD